MFNAFENLLKNQFYFLKETPVLVAVSGGLDSMVLTHLCRKRWIKYRPSTLQF